MEIRIEEDIKTIKYRVDKCREEFEDFGEISFAYSDLDRIENILSERETDKERIQELEEINTANRKVIVEQCDYIQNKSIPVQKIKDLLTEIQEEYNKLDKEIDKQIKDKNKDYYKCKENIAIMQTLAYCRDKFEGLLEEE